MAKKSIANVKKELSDTEKMVKVIRTKRSDTTGAYTYKELFVTADKVKSVFEN